MPDVHYLMLNFLILSNSLSLSHYLVVRCFEDDNVVHVDGGIGPVRDKDVIDTELILKDIETLEKRIERLEKQPI